MTQEGEPKEKEKVRGFAGLSSLASDMDAILIRPKKPMRQNQIEEEPYQARPVFPADQSSQGPRSPQPYQALSRSPSSTSGTKWVLGVAAVIGVVWVVNVANQTPSPSTAAYRQPAQPTAPSYTAPLSEPRQLLEDRPPVGQSLVLTTSQITYCLAEDIRLEGSRSVIDNYSDAQVNRFNVLVDDYNSRCGNFRYRSGALESARRTVEAFRTQLLADGRTRF